MRGLVDGHSGTSRPAATIVAMARFIKVEDVAEEFAIAERQVYALLHSGALLAIQVGGRGTWRIEREELEQYIADQYEAQRRRIAETDGHNEPPADTATEG